MMEAVRKWAGYLEHQTNDLLGVFTANVGKGYCTIFAAIIQRHYRWRNFSGVPWCAVFLHAVFLEMYGKETARRLLGKPHPGTRVLARRMRRRKCLMPPDYTPRPGDIIFLQNGDGRISHCGIVIEVYGYTVMTIEGNTVDPSGHFAPEQGGAVAIRERLFSDRAIMNYAKIEVK